MRTIFTVDDDRNFLKILAYQVEELGFQVSPFGSPIEALEEIRKKRPPDLVITDLRMPEMSGLDFLDRLVEFEAALPVMVLTAHGSIDVAVEATRRGAFEFLTKPFEKEQLEQSIRNALKLSTLTRENERLNQEIRRRFQFDGIIGTSPRFCQLLNMAEQLAEVDTTVLIQGESGTGKELIARAIHFNSPRKTHPFVTVNCGAIPPELAESELFGHRKGAFTGAASDRKGKFEAASSGTVFLDEIGELPLSIQVKLLRVLQEKEIDVVGDPHSRLVDLRIIAATNRDLLEMVGNKEFREDLYYRLSVAPLRLPSLKERREDIPILVHHFLTRFQERLGRTVRIAPDVTETLQLHSWPGIVRELENVIERLVVFASEDRITTRDLPSTVRHHAMQSLGDVVIHMPEKGFSLEELERDILETALEMHEWNQTHAAEYLKMTRNTLIYRMQKYHLKPGKASP